MKNAIKSFWRNLLIKLNNIISRQLYGTPTQEIRASEANIVNFFVMILKKVLNHVFLDCDFEVITDSAVAEPLKELCEDLQKNCYKIGGLMLGGSDTPGNISECWCVPYFDTAGGKAKLAHSYIGGDRIMITKVSGDSIKECYMIIDGVQRNNKAYLLCRRHLLDDNGDLTVSYFVGNERAEEVSADIPEWDGIVTTETVYPGVNHIGFGRYKSPVISFDGDDTYGKALNCNCGVIEKQIQTCLRQIQDEFAHKGVRLFADESIVRSFDANGNPTNKSVIDEFIYPMRSLPGTGGNLISEFSPAIRESAYYTHLTELVRQYEALCGVNNILTHDTTANATATEIKALCIDNIALEDNIRRAVRFGNIMTLEADCIYLGIPLDRGLWTYDETWTDIYENEQQKLDNMLKMYENGAAEQLDLIKYWYPTLTDEQAQEKADRINAARQSDAKSGIESMLRLNM